MRTLMLAAVMLAGSSIVAVAPTLAQDAAGAPSLSSLSGPDYVKLTADGDNFEIQSGRIAITKSRREDVKGFAKQLVADHMTLDASLKAGLSNQDRKIAAPSTKLSSANQAKIDLLRKAPKATFDQIYLQQQVQAHQSMLALQQAYTANGTDPALKQIAATAIPVVTQHSSALAGLAGGAM